MSSADLLAWLGRLTLPPPLAARSSAAAGAIPRATCRVLLVGQCGPPHLLLHPMPAGYRHTSRQRQQTGAL